MAKRFRLRISRAISSTLQSCRSKDPTILPQDPLPSFSALKIHAHNPSAPLFNRLNENNCHVLARIYETSSPRRKISVSSTSPPPETTKRRGKRNKKRINIPTSRLRMSTSSADSGWFSNEEVETLVSSSISFSTDSSLELNNNSQLHPIREVTPPHRRRTSCRKRISRRTRRAVLETPAEVVEGEAEAEAPARLSVLKRLIPCTVDGKVRESYAIVKRSKDPYEDFKNSMMDMIVEKQMFDRGDLEQLLQCFLSLNSRHYHGVIVEAFSEIWDAIFPANATAKTALPSDGADQNRGKIHSPVSF